MAKRNGQYLSVRQQPHHEWFDSMLATYQSQSLAEFKKTMDLQGNISNNTVYADAEGNIAYWHGNCIPKEIQNLTGAKPWMEVLLQTEWKGYHPSDETVHIINPPNGWLQNCNSTPFTVAGNNSPKKENYPAYMAPDGENFRGINAVRVLSEENKLHD